MRAFKLIAILSIITCSTVCQKKNKQDERSAGKSNSQRIIVENKDYAFVGLTKLSEYHFFTGKLSELNPSENVAPYDLNSALFSDYAKKKRFIYIPDGKKIGLRKTEVIDFPTGTVLIKNFHYTDDQLKNQPGKILETRLLIKEENGWKALPYIWNESQTEAYLEIAGGSIPVFLNNQEKPIDYGIPTMAECKSCHEKKGKIEPIGPTVRQLNRKYEYEEGKFNQLSYLHKIGWIEGSVNPFEMEISANYSDPDSGTPEERARAYIDINCAHCHRPEGPAKNSGLNLRYNNRDPFSLGINKAPVAAGKGSGGLSYDIVSGKPEKSILFYRMKSTDPAVMMPELGKKTIHHEGLELIREWILNMK